MVYFITNKPYIVSSAISSQDSFSWKNSARSMARCPYPKSTGILLPPLFEGRYLVLLNQHLIDPHPYQKSRPDPFGFIA